MHDLFAWLSGAVEGGTFLALSAALIWGVLSVVLSPCHLASIPLIVGFISGQGRVSAGRAFSLASLFASGILITIALVGLLTAAAGRMLGDLGRWGNYFVAVIFFLVGLHLLGILPAPWVSRGPVGVRRKGLVAALVLGLVFGIALGPCTFAYMAPVLAVAFKTAKTAWAHAGLLLLVYGVGHCAVIVVAGTSTELVQKYLDWNEKSRGVQVVKGICGVLVMLAGVYLIVMSR